MFSTEYQSRISPKVFRSYIFEITVFWKISRKISGGGGGFKMTLMCSNVNLMTRLRSIYGGSQLDNNCFSGSLQRTVEHYV